MSNKTIKIFRKNKVKGEDGYKTFSIRIKDETVTALDELATQSNRSRNELIDLMLEQAVNNVEILDGQ
jgi:predicted DNA-binding protein